MKCKICESEPDWKVEDLVEDKKYWACEQHLLQVLPKSVVVKLAWQDRKEKAIAVGS